MKSKFFYHEPIDKNFVLPFFEFSELVRLQKKEKKIKDLMATHASPLEISVIKYFNFYIPIGGVEAYLLFQHQPQFVNCFVLSYAYVHNLVEKENPSLELIFDEFYSKVIILKKMKNEVALSITEYALFFLTSLTSFYKIKEVATLSEDSLKVLKEAFVPVDFVYKLTKAFGASAVNEAVTIARENSVADSELPKFLFLYLHDSNDVNGN